MRLDVFHVGDGDGVLLTAADETGEDRHVLVDGGRGTQFKKHARRFLYDLPRIDVVCVSHIDEDHIAGVLRMIEDEVEWRVHDFTQSLFDAGEGAKPKKPSFPRPPAIGEIWHNALFELVGDEMEVGVQGALTSSASLLAGSDDPAVQDLASKLDNLATGERSALELSRRISGNQLDIPRNRPRDATMLRGGGTDEIEVGGMRFLLLGPTQQDLDKLKTVWAAWIASNEEALVKLRRELRSDEEAIGRLAASIVANPMLQSSLGEGLSAVTAPNLASLMFLLEADGKSVLLTGDGVSSEILDGLEHHGKLDDDGRVHVDVLKVQHHGALANITEDFVQKVSADHYLFCGNGAHHNPELEAVEQMALARLTGIAGQPAVEAGRPFKFWFSSSPRTPDLSESRQHHMQEVEDKLEELRAAHDPGEDVFDFEMLDAGRLTIKL